MIETVELFRQGKMGELWQSCCGFIDLSLRDSMMIQQRLLLEQIELLKRCKLGRHIMRGAMPKTVEEFRQQVPLTTYADYEPYLLPKHESALPEKPMIWQHTSGRSGEYPFKWAPLTERQFQEIRRLLFTILLFATCKEKGEVNLKEHDKILYALAPPPYATGSLVHSAHHDFLDFLPSVEEAEGLSFEDRIGLGFELALSRGMDLFFAISSVMVAIGERFRQGNENMDIKPLLRKPKTLSRLVKGLIKSKMARRPMLPRDVWSLKGLVTAGTDGSIYREKIKEMWGRYPLDIYGCTEAVMIAMQTWDYQGMTFIPHLNFLEFIPEEESLQSRQDHTYQPTTVLLDEVKAGENYEIVITNFQGGAFVRYRLGDMVKITSLRNEELKIDLPQMVFHARVDDMIDIAGFTRLTEKVIWQAIENSGVAYEDWVVCKEVKEKPVLHLYLEPKENGYVPGERVGASIHQELKKLDKPYAELESFLGLQPMEVTLLPKGAFHDYMLKQRAAGADLAHLKPPHINPSHSIVDCLVNGGGKVTAGSKEEQELEIARTK